MELLAQFQELAPSSNSDTFNAVRLTAGRDDFLGKDERGAPVFLVADDGEPIYRPVVQHRHLSAAFCMLCRLNVDGAEVVGRFALIRFEGSAHELHELFIRCVRAATTELPVSVRTPEIEDRVTRLLALFRVLSRPAGREISGLWTELFCILNSGNVPEAVDRWHASNSETFDFSWSQVCLEVKSTVGVFRIHEFALEQLCAPGGGTGFVASVLLRTSNDGIGVMGLAQQIEHQLDGSSMRQSKLWSLVLQSLGEDFSATLDRRFDLAFASRHLLVYRMEDIPSLAPTCDSRISAVRFRVDLSSVSSSLGQNGIAALKACF